MGKKVDLTGKKFGRLTVIKKHSVVGNGETMWLCKCDCGNDYVIVSRGNLKSGNVKSCGCLHKEIVSKSKKKYNKYDLSGEYGIGWTFNTNAEFYFDLEDYDKIKDYCWLENDQGYIIARDKNRKSPIRQHRLILNVLDVDIDIDHVNNNKKDNRKMNLRFTNKQTNGINRGKNKNNKLGVKGVSFKNGKYYARIMKDGKTYYLGVFDNLDDAINARKEKEIELFGDFAFKGDLYE